MHGQVSQGEGCAECLKTGCGAQPARRERGNWGAWQGLKGLAPRKAHSSEFSTRSLCFLIKCKTAIKITLPTSD